MNLRSHAKLASRASRRAGLWLVALGSLVPIGTAAGAVTEGAGCTDGGTTVTCAFWSKSGTLTMPDGQVIDVMGYSDTAGGSPVVPGPTIVADAGDTVTVTLNNALAVPTGMLFQEQAVALDTIGAPAAGTTTYTFTASQPGTYLYEASPFVRTSGGGGSQYQVAMGMNGALVVRPATAGQAYTSAESAYNAEHLVVVNELDKDITAANAATFDMRRYSPDYFLVNGKASPDAATLPANAGDRVLLRWVNAGVKAHSVALLGAGQRVVGEDGNALPNPRDMVAETLGAGQTEDVIVTLAADASGKLPVYDAGLWLNNNTSAGMGGALTFLEVTNSGGATDTAGPGTTNVAFDLTGGALTATVSDAATGGANVTAAEYFIDTPGAPGSGTALAGTFGSPSVNVSATISPFPAGPHTLYVHGQDAGGYWGPVSSIIVANDTIGPLTRSLALSPNPGNGSKDVALSATGDDSAGGGSNITAGEYKIGTGSALTMAPNVTAPVAALDTTILAASVEGLPEGSHGLSVRSRDSAGNWGAWATIALLKDTTGPSTGPVTSSYSANQQALLLTATVTDPSSNGVSSNVAAAEGFIDAVGANGTGFPLTPVDGAWSTGSEGVRGDVPLVTLAALSPGAHTISLHGRDASGNWGPTSAASTNPLTPQSGANPLTLARSNVIFGTGFESTQAAATITGVGRLAFVPAANMAGTGRLGMRVTLSGEISPKTPVSAYVTDNSPAAESTYDARFSFNPNESTPGGGANGITILAGYTADDGRGGNRFDVRYRQKGSVRQVRLNVRSGRGIAATRWFTIPRASATSVEVSWQAERSAKVTLRLKGKVAQTLSGLDTGIRSRIESVRFGVQGLSRSTGGRRGTLYLDSFVSTRDGVVGP